MPTISVQISQPCAENWAAMIPTAAGRHCATCQKTVVDFTWKTDAEILAYLAGAPGETCGRLREDQQNRVLVEGLTASPAPWWRTWLATVATLWGLRASSGQTAEAHVGPAPSAHHAPTNTGKPRHLARASSLLHGVVRDAATHAPLAGVAVFLKGENRAATTDSSGQFSLRLPARRPKGPRRLVLHRAGYHSRQLPVAPAPGAVQVALRADPAASGVEVVGLQREREYRMSSGSVTSIVLGDSTPAPPAARPRHGFFYWLTRPFRRR